MSSNDPEPTSQSELENVGPLNPKMNFKKLVSSNSLLSEPENECQPQQILKSGRMNHDSPSQDSGFVTQSEESLRRARASSSESEFKYLSSIFDADNFERPPRRLPHEYVVGLMSRWRSAAKRVRSVYADPWSHFAIEEFPCRRAKRYRYSAIRKVWTEDFIEVKVHPEPFARGAMRECFRLKKLPTIGNKDWKTAQNYVAKKYMNEVDRRVIFEDVKLQMDAKLWAEEFNRYHPPKKIDIMQMCIIEMIDGENQFYHLEHFIEGDYIKYNSNSGFVSDDFRLTPQAFSHFTFERSGHQMIVVDIQGVGDLYTDPQIHTALGTDYGDGNLGTRGMALFFRSHECNDICHSLCLSPFDLAQSEMEEHEKRAARQVPAATVFSKEVPVSACFAIPDQDDAMDFLRRRTLSRMSTDSIPESDDHGDDCVCLECVRACDTGCIDDEEDEEIEETKTTERKVGFHDLRVTRSRNSSFASSYGTESMNSSRVTKNTEREDFWRAARKQSMPSCVIGAIELCDAIGAETRNYQTSILGQVHIDVARYYELGRFGELDRAKDKNRSTDTSGLSSVSPTEEYDFDRKAACFHLAVAVKCGNLESIMTTAQISYDLPHDLLKNAQFDDLFFENDEKVRDRNLYGFFLMEQAAEQGDKTAMMFVAKAYETGLNMGEGAHPNYKKAVNIYQKLLGFQDEKDGNEVGEQVNRYQILAKIAELYKEGGYELEQDFESAYNYYTDAAEAALEAANGKLANKFFEYAEQCAM